MRGGSQRLSEGDDAAARHGQGSDNNGAARAQHAPPKGERRGRTRLASPSFLCENNYLTLNLFRMRPCRTGLGPLPSPDGVARAATNACEIAPRVTLRPEPADANANGCRRRGRARRAAIGQHDVSKRRAYRRWSQMSTRMGVGLKPLHGLLICGQLERTQSTSISASKST